ncbi:uncharacterized protein LOC142348285 isoform X2 [Convolutriloba macropyga]|uniref:uncharacterized protein LOC142348285 isoform X2 n=1 Tax=Convolutriloba macropyga TaxID=536237 RepID=UPI003F523AB3
MKTGTKNKVYVKFFYAEENEPRDKILLNSQIEPQSYNQQFRPKQESNFEVLIENWGYVNLTRIQVGFYDDPKEKSSVLDDDLDLLRLDLLDGVDKYMYLYYGVSKVVTKESGMVELFKQTRDPRPHRVTWPRNCPNNSETVTGIHDRCYQFLNINKGFKEAIDYCKSSLGGRGHLLSLNPQDYHHNLRTYFQLDNGGLFWVRIAKIEIRASLLRLTNLYWGDAETFEPINYDSIVWDGNKHQPQNRNHECCGCLRGDFGWHLHDGFCNSSVPFICEISDSSIFQAPIDNLC